MAPADHLAPSQAPPAGLAPAEAPLFVSLGFDDNDSAAGMTWALDMLRARHLHASFFLIADRADDAAVAETWRRALDEGHELGNHSYNHLPARDGRRRSRADWQRELAAAAEALTRAVPGADLQGFRAPFLEYNDAALAAVAALGLRYDCSIEEGFEPDQDGSNAYWPYTLDHGSPGHAAQDQLRPLHPHPGLWELPVSAVFIPPDDRCAEYGVPPGLRARLQARQPWFDVNQGAITGFDHNLWAARAAGGFEMTGAESRAALRYTLDQRARGNRAPLLFGGHTHCYVDDWDGDAPGIPHAADRRAVLQDLLDHASAQRDARVTTHAALLAWLRNVCG